MYVDDMIVCKECGFECSAMNALGYHLRNHKMTYEEYVVKHVYAGLHPVCPTCRTSLLLKKGGFNTFCSKRCASSGDNNPMSKLKGEASPNFGQKRTEAQRKNYSKGAKLRWEIHGDKLRKMMKTPEYRQLQTKAQKKANKDNPEFVQKRTKAVHRFWSSNSEETRQARKAASDRAIIQLELGQIGPRAPYKVKWMTNPFTGRDEFMHSSWETAFLERCITEQYPVTKVHDLRIPYVDSEGIDRTYIPDFMGLEEKVVFEIKGLIDDNVVLKRQALDDWAEHNGYETVFIDHP